MLDKSCGAVLLSAGKGTRLKSIDVPKVMREIGDKPMVSYSVETLKKTGLTSKQICLVVGFYKEKVMEYFGDNVIYAEQKELKGTAHAAYIGMKNLPQEVKYVIVMGGDDSAFYKPNTIEKLVELHISNKVVLTLLSAEKSPEGLGRVIRKTDGSIEIIEKENITEEQKKIREISTGTFVFTRAWFESIFPDMPTIKGLGEFGLPTALTMAREQNEPYQVIKLSDPEEWFGVNTLEELEEADKRKRI